MMREDEVEPDVIAKRYEEHYLADMGALGVSPPDIAPHATAEIGPMVEMIAELIAKGNAYETQGHVLFSVASDADYGSLSRRDREAMIAGARVEVAPYKRDPADFVLWKPSDEGVVGWDSPWGRGRPGWHIECSAMIRAHLGRTIDIHGGGLDLIFPHHENEIAQSRCAHDGAPLANYWVHNGFVDMGAEKMSKSLGNVITVDRLLADGHRGEVLRLALLSAHYRSPLPWTDSLIAQSKATLDRLYRAAGDAVPGEIDPGVIEALQDDLNIPLAMSRLGAMRDPGAIRASAGLLGLLTVSNDTWFRGTAQELSFSHFRTEKLRVDLVEKLNWLMANSERLPKEVQADIYEKIFAADMALRIAKRDTAKKNKDFAEADRIRDELAAEGILLEDGPGGTTWRRA
jgi:cysteinyl-tRNA synthetase